MQLPPQLADGGVARLLGRRTEPGSDQHMVKGLAYRGHLEFVQNEIEGGLQAHQQALADLPMLRGDETRDFFETTFLASSLYDVYPLAIAGIACARITGEDYIEFVKRRTFMQVRKDIRGVHKFLVKIVSAKMVASRLPRLIMQYMNFTTTTVDRPSPTQVHGRIEGIPIALGGWIAAVVESYMIGVLEIAGADNAEVEAVCVIEEGGDHARLDLHVNFT
jgi:hypothetical protein